MNKRIYSKAGMRLKCANTYSNNCGLISSRQRRRLEERLARRNKNGR